MQMLAPLKGTEPWVEQSRAGPGVIGRAPGMSILAELWGVEGGLATRGSGGGRLSLLLLLLGEFQSVAEDFESRLLIIESTCLGRFTADTEHLLPPGGEKTRH